MLLLRCRPGARDADMPDLWAQADANLLLWRRDSRNCENLPVLWS